MNSFWSLGGDPTREKLDELLHSILALEIGLESHDIWTPASLERVGSLPGEVREGFVEQLGRYVEFFKELKERRLTVEAGYREILEAASHHFGMKADLDLLPQNVPDHCTLHAYLLSGHCLFFSPNFIKHVKYDLFSLLTEPWFELFGREHHEDLDAFVSSTQGFLGGGQREPVDIRAIRPNVIYLEKLPSRPRIESRGYFYSPIYDHGDNFLATLVVSEHGDVAKSR